MEWGGLFWRTLNGLTLGVFVCAHNHQQMLLCHQDLLDLYSAGKISVQLDSVIDFPAIPEYLARLERREVQGKIVVRTQGEDI